MVAILKNRQFIFVSFFGLSIAFAGWYVGCITRKISLQSIASDDRFASDLSLEIITFLEQSANQTNSLRFKELKTKFPMIDQLKIQRVGLNKNHVQVFAGDLIFRLGSKFVLDKNKNVFLAADFSDSALHDLPVIYQHLVVENEAEIEPEQRDFLQKLSDFVVQAYEIHWHGLNQIILIDKQGKTPPTMDATHSAVQSTHHGREIIVRHDQVISTDLLKTCYKLFEDYQIHVNKKCLGTIKADLRFDGQIIMAC